MASWVGVLPQARLRQSGREGRTPLATAVFALEGIAFHLALEGVFYICLRGEREKLSPLCNQANSSNVSGVEITHNTHTIVPEL